jgi:hypothetical protein
LGQHLARVRGSAEEVEVCRVRWKGREQREQGECGGCRHPLGQGRGRWWQGQTHLKEEHLAAEGVGQAGSYGKEGH